jgi:hypothetical protein
MNEPGNPAGNAPGSGPAVGGSYRAREWDICRHWQLDVHLRAWWCELPSLRWDPCHQVPVKHPANTQRPGTDLPTDEFAHQDHPDQPWLTCQSGLPQWDSVYGCD